MSRRWYSRLLFVIIFFVILIVLYTMLESISVNRDERQVMRREEKRRKVMYDCFWIEIK